MSTNKVIKNLIVNLPVLLNYSLPCISKYFTFVSDNLIIYRIVDLKNSLLSLNACLLRL